MQQSQIDVSMSLSDLKVNPGESIETTITVRNSSQLVDLFTFEVAGVEPSWVQMSSGSVAAMPGDEVKTVIAFAPPRESTSTAGDHEFTVRVKSQKFVDEVHELRGTLDVTPYHEYQASMRPQKFTGAKGRFYVNLENKGNSDLVLTFEGRDDEDRCGYLFRPQLANVPPGNTSEVQVTVDPGKRPLRGRAQTVPFTLSISPTYDPSAKQELPGQLDVTAWLRFLPNRAPKPRTPRTPSLNARRVGNSAGNIQISKDMWFLAIGGVMFITFLVLILVLAL